MPVCLTQKIIHDGVGAVGEVPNIAAAVHGALAGCTVEHAAGAERWSLHGHAAITAVAERMRRGKAGGLAVLPDRSGTVGAALAGGAGDGAGAVQGQARIGLRAVRRGAKIVQDGVFSVQREAEQYAVPHVIQGAVERVALRGADLRAAGDCADDREAGGLGGSANGRAHDRGRGDAGGKQC